jgi:hypothetical protein
MPTTLPIVAFPTAYVTNLCHRDKEPLAIGPVCPIVTVASSPRKSVCQACINSGLFRVTPRKVRRYLVRTVLRYQRYGRIISKLHMFDDCDGQNGDMFRTIWVKYLVRLLGKAHITPSLDDCEHSFRLEIRAACPTTKRCDAARR